MIIESTVANRTGTLPVLDVTFMDEQILRYDHIRNLIHEGENMDRIKDFEITVLDWADPKIETSPYLSSFYRAFIDLPPTHTLKQSVYHALLSRDHTENSSGTNTANVFHRSFMYLHLFGCDDDDTTELPKYLSRIPYMQEPDEWRDLFDNLANDYLALNVIHGKVISQNAMANKPTRYRSVAKVLASTEFDNRRVKIYDVGASIGLGASALLSNEITNHLTGATYLTSEHIAEVTSIDIAPDPLEGDSEFGSETLKWIYACSFHPGQELGQRESYDEWKSKIIDKRGKANGRFKTQYNTDAIEYFASHHHHGDEIPVIIFNTILYQLPQEKREKMLATADDFINRNGKGGKIIITDFFEHTPTLRNGNKLDLAFTKNWRSTEQNPTPYMAISLNYNHNNTSKTLTVIDEWTSGRCTKSAND